MRAAARGCSGCSAVRHQEHRVCRSAAHRSGTVAAQSGPCDPLPRRGRAAALRPCRRRRSTGRLRAARAASRVASPRQRRVAAPARRPVAAVRRVGAAGDAASSAAMSAWRGRRAERDVRSASAVARRRRRTSLGRRCPSPGGRLVPASLVRSASAGQPSRHRTSVRRRERLRPAGPPRSAPSRRRRPSLRGVATDLRAPSVSGAPAPRAAPAAPRGRRSTEAAVGSRRSASSVVGRRRRLGRAAPRPGGGGTSLGDAGLSLRRSPTASAVRDARRLRGEPAARAAARRGRCAERRRRLRDRGRRGHAATGASGVLGRRRSGDWVSATGASGCRRPATARVGHAVARRGTSSAPRPGGRATARAG